jgi:hypothetical protein
MGNAGKDNKMRGLRKVFTKVSLSLVVLLTIASIIGMADVVQAAFTTTSEVKLTPSDAATGDVFGNSVSISGDTAVVGAAYKNSGRGAAYIFVRSGSNWIQQAKITASDAVAGDYFGISVSVSGNTAVVGAYYKDAKKGAAYVFVRSGTIWNQQAKLTASDGAADDYFGNSVSVSSDTVVVGAYYKDSHKGAAYVFVRSGSIWNQQAKLTASDGAANEYFGDEVSVSSDTAVVGAYGKNSNKGAAYVFVRSGSNWNQQAKLTASDGAASDYFGTSVSISSDTAIVGASGKDSHTGAAYVFVRSGSIWSQQIKLTASDPSAGGDYFGHSVSVSGDTALVGAYCKDSNTGAAYVFVRSGSNWSQQVKLTASDAASGDYFGDSVSVSSDTAVVGAMYKDSAKGAAYIYKSTIRIIPTFTLILMPPVVSTSAATNVNGNSATLNGNLTSLGTATTANVSFEYGTTASYGSTTTAHAMTAVGSYSADIAGLIPGTTYHFRAKAQSSYGTATGTDMTFTTPTQPPAVSTSVATDIDESSATLNGVLTSLGSASSVNVCFEYGTTTSYGTTTETIPMYGAVGFCTVITGLNPGTTYHFRAKAESTYGTAIGGDMTFTTNTPVTPTTTPPTTTTTTQPPAVDTSAVTKITDSSVTLNGNLTSLGTATTIDVSFEYGTSTSYGSTTTPQAMTATGVYSADVTGLTPGTTFHFRAKAKGIYGMSTGSDMTFTTNTLATTTTATSTPTTTTSPTKPSAISTSATGTPPEEENQTQSQLYIWIIVAVGVVIIASAVFFIVRNRKTPKPMAKGQKTETTVPPQTETKSKQTDYFDMLKKLADLRDQGVITKEEFESKKSEILRKMSDSE